MRIKPCQRYASRRMRVLGSLVFLGTLCGLVGGMPVVGSGSIPSTPPNTEFEFWPPPTTIAPPVLSEPVGATVRLNSGSGTIVALPYGSPPTAPLVQIGMLSANRSAVFEGLLSSIRLRAGPNSSPLCMGTYSDRNPTDGSVGDSIVGEGATMLLANSVPFGVYGSFDALALATPRARLLLARCTTTALTISRGATDILTVDVSDWGLCSQGAVNSYRIRGANPVPQLADFKVLAPLGSGQCSPTTPVAFDMSGVNNDMDSCALDGTLLLDITLENTGSSTVMLVYMEQGSALQTAVLPPFAGVPAPVTISGRFIQLDLKYVNAIPTYVNTVNLTVVAHP